MKFHDLPMHCINGVFTSRNHLRVMSLLGADLSRYSVIWTFLPIGIGIKTFCSSARFQEEPRATEAVRPDKGTEGSWF